jgi:hypothetical protein
MADKVTTLIEYAFNATDDKEKLAALANAKKIYQNSGIKLAPPKPVPTATVPEVVLAPVVDKSKLEFNLMTAETLAARFQKQAADLRVENKELKAQLQEHEILAAVNKDKLVPGAAKIVGIIVIGFGLAILIATGLAVLL